MKTFNCFRRVDKLGRIVLPKEVRKLQQLSEGSRLELSADSENIYLKKVCVLKNNALISAFIKTFYEEFNKHILVFCDGEVVDCTSKYGKYKNNFLTQKVLFKECKNGAFYEKCLLFEGLCSDLTFFKLTNMGDDLGFFVVLDKLNLQEDLVCKVFIKMFNQEG